MAVHRVHANTKVPADWRNLPFSEAVVVNPPVALKRGCDYPHIDMALLTPGTRSVRAVATRQYRGGGSRFEPGDTLFARITPCLENGKTSRFDPSYPDAHGPAHGSTEFIVLRGRANVSDTHFVHYLAKSPDIRDFAISQMTGTSGRQRVPTDCFDHLLVSVPPIAEQRAIADILGALDDKIELNRRMNETLEAMARALFKSWFVDFEPVRAKMAGRDTGLPPDITALFPGDTTSTDIGEIPEGWTVRPLGELIQLNYGKSLRRDKRVPGKFPVYGSGGTDSSHVEPLVEHPTVVVGRKGTVGSVYWAPQGCWPIDTTYFVTSQLPMIFAYRLLQHLPLATMNTDAAVPGLNRSNAYSLRVPLPSVQQVAEFANVANLLQARIDAGETHMCSLAETRNALLPKLVSGEIRVQQAEPALNDACNHPR